ncbi:mitochondrial inner membrane i-AAA protease supercomplex subunit Mgr3p [Trichomonascus vanleenenianus]|uniref:mitochondrial inner membrane i-AAA protease supercomplex subunit Mgr3p n=1 Tax=Trichomonascus vanleenenianus TaxID=2268995 RepID=UPI003ECA46EE
MIRIAGRRRLLSGACGISRTAIGSRVCARSITHAFQFPEPPPPEPKRSWRWPIIFAVALGVSYGAFRLYTRHNYPPSVAALLREGLRAEIDGNGKGYKDYNLALQKYLEALEKADEANMDKMSDEYTGLQIKICEMYEKLGMMEEARLMYRELGISFISALVDGMAVPAGLRPHLIQRDLRVALKTAMHESAVNPTVAKMGLLVHFKLAQKEVAARSPELAKMIANERNPYMAQNISLALSVDEESKNREQMAAWQPFRDELFNARDMYVALCLATGDIGHALQTKLATTEWMTTAGCDIGDILMSFYNVGSLFYLQSEELEVRELKKTETKEEKDAETAKKLAKDSLQNSSTCFHVILDVIGKLPGKIRRENSVAEVQALSTYGLGVIALHQKEYAKAEDMLREARVRAKGCEFGDLVNSSELELDKLKKLQDELKKGNVEQYDPPSMDVLLMRKDLPVDPEHPHSHHGAKK